MQLDAVLGPKRRMFSKPNNLVPNYSPLPIQLSTKPRLSFKRQPDYTAGGISDKEKQRRIELRLYFRCGKQDHISRNCQRQFTERVNGTIGPKESKNG